MDATRLWSDAARLTPLRILTPLLSGIPTRLLCTEASMFGLRPRGKVRAGRFLWLAGAAYLEWKFCVVCRRDLVAPLDGKKDVLYLCEGEWAETRKLYWSELVNFKAKFTNNSLCC